MLRPDPNSRASTTECLEAIHALLDYHDVSDRRAQALRRFEDTARQNKEYVAVSLLAKTRVLPTPLLYYKFTSPSSLQVSNQ